MEQSKNGKASRWNFDNLHYDHVMYADVKGELAVVYIMPFGEEDLCFLRNSTKEEWERYVILLNQEVGDIYMTSREICNSCNGEIVFVVIELGYFTFHFHDVGKNSWRKLETNVHPYEGYIKDVYSYAENLFPLGRISSPCGDDFVSSEEELLRGDDFISSEEELPCGNDFVSSEEELLRGDYFVSSEEELPYGDDFVSLVEELCLLHL
ncbi:hypothetical protein FXO37_09403 [Capsicum annuum]|nr:hypothetical protein FXO37_09403 [Capsicum annuum]